MADNRIRLPSSEGGLVRYDEGAASRVVIKPETVIGICVGVTVLFAILAIFSSGLLG